MASRRSRKSRSGARRSSRKGSRRASRKVSRKSRKSRRAQRGGGNKWLTFTKKHRASTIAMLKKKKNYGEGKGQLKLQQDALKEMSKMYKSQKGGCDGGSCDA